MATRAFRDCSRADTKLPHPAAFLHMDEGSSFKSQSAGRPFCPQSDRRRTSRKLKREPPGSDEALDLMPVLPTALLDAEDGLRGIAQVLIGSQVAIGDRR